MTLWVLGSAENNCIDLSVSPHVYRYIYLFMCVFASACWKIRAQPCCCLGWGHEAVAAPALSGSIEIDDRYRDR